VLGVAAAAVFAGLLARMYQLQIVDGAAFAARADRNFVRDYVVPAYRGPILDVTGTVLAANRSSFNVYVTPHFFLDPQRELDLMKELLHLSDFRVAAIVEELARPSRFPRLEPFLAVEDVRRDEVALLESARWLLPGVHVAAVPHREYPLGNRAAHLIGYLNEVSDAELARDASYRPGDVVGRHGIERAWEMALRGLDGRESLVRDARGFVVDDPARLRRASLPPPLEPVPGAAVVLTIDADLQAVMEAAFDAYPSGAAVIVEAKTGRVRGLYSKPSYDLNLMGGGLSLADKAVLDSDPYFPQIDRTVYQRLPPGSTFKVVTALAALEEGVINPSDEIFCPGYYKLGDHVFRCHLRSGHGLMNLRRAIVASCDTYFWHVSEMLGIDTIARYARDMGLGEVTGVGLNDEVPGIMPDKAWYDRFSPDGFRPGHTANVAVGQGSVTVTPLQMALLYAAIANGGKLMRPSVVDRLVDPGGATIERFEPTVRRTLAVDPENLKIVGEALWGVTHSPGGTAVGAAMRFPKLKVAGKTGTAQVITTSFGPGMGAGRVRVKRGRAEESHAWFVAYAPYDDPQVAIAVVVEHGGGGGAAAAPVAMKILDGYFRLDALRGAGDVRFPLPVPEKPLRYKIAHDAWAGPSAFGGTGVGAAALLGAGGAAAGAEEGGAGGAETGAGAEARTGAAAGSGAPGTAGSGDAGAAGGGTPGEGGRGGAATAPPDAGVVDESAKKLPGVPLW
jgi:penicillin-binding protein 2